MPLTTDSNKIVTALFEYIKYMGTGDADSSGVPEDEFMANVFLSEKRKGISFDGFGSSPFLQRERLEKWLDEKLK